MQMPIQICPVFRFLGPRYFEVLYRMPKAIDITDELTRKPLRRFPRSLVPDRHLDYRNVR